MIYTNGIFLLTVIFDYNNIKNIPLVYAGGETWNKSRFYEKGYSHEYAGIKRVNISRRKN